MVDLKRTSQNSRYALPLIGVPPLSNLLRTKKWSLSQLFVLLVVVWCIVMALTMMGWMRKIFLPSPPGYIIDVDYLMDTLPPSAKPPLMETAYLNTRHPNWAKVYQTLVSKYPSPNAGVQEQHMSQVWLAATLHQCFGFQIITDKKQLRDIQPQKQIVFLFWGHTEHWATDAPIHPDEGLRITGDEMEGSYTHFGKAFSKFLRTRKSSWIAPGGRNLVYAASFPRRFAPQPYKAAMSQATMIVTEHGMVPQEIIATMNLHLIPYSLALSSWKGKSLLSLTKENENEQRTNFVMLRAGCDPHGTYGKRLRQALVDLYSPYENNDHGLELPVRGIDVKCDSANHEGARQDGHGGYQQRLQKSLFCLVTAGDTDSSLRLMETMAHGCVPVLVGPPFHTLSDLWTWSDLIVTIYVHNQTWVAGALAEDQGSTKKIFPGGWYHGGGWVESVESLDALPQKLVDIYYHRYHRVKAKLDAFRRTYLHRDDSPFPVPVYMKKLAERVIEEFQTGSR